MKIRSCVVSHFREISEKSKISQIGEKILEEAGFRWANNAYRPKDKTAAIATAINEIKEIGRDFGFNFTHNNPGTFYDVSDALATAPDS